MEQGTGDHLGLWLIKVLSTTVGETGADSLAVHVGLGAALTTGVAGVLLAAWFGVWFRAEGTLSNNAIDTRSRELFYWGAILVTFALGTAAGDLATEALGLGFRLGVLAFGALIAVIAVAWRAGMNAVLAFWLAYRARAYPDAPARCLPRRFARAVARIRRPGIGNRGHQRLVPGGDCRPGHCHQPASPACRLLTAAVGAVPSPKVHP